MTKPPKSTPHSDIYGVHEDELRNTDVAHELGQSAEDVAEAKKDSAARPRAMDQESLDDRTA